MYNLEQLNSKTTEELKTIATEMGARLTGAEDKAALMFRIIDEQAATFASSTTSSDAEGAQRKRSRVSIKKVDRVLSANQSRTKKIDKQMKKTVDESLYGTLSDEEKSLLAATSDSSVADTAAPADTTDTPADAEAAPKKRGRKKKEADAAPAEPSADTAAPDDAEAAPKKRGRRKKEADAPADVQPDTTTPEAAPSDTAPEPAAPAAPQQQPEAQPVAASGSFVPPTDGSDFIIIQGIPSLDDIDFAAASKSNKTKAVPAYAAAPRREAPVAAPAPAAAPVKQTPQPVRKEKRPAYDFSHIVKITGVLEVEENTGYLRSSDYNYLPSPDDVLLTLQQIKHWGLKMGDVVECYVRPPREGERYFTLTDIVHVNGCDPSVIRGRNTFEYLTPLFPDEKFKLCSGDGTDSKSSRIVDLFAPIGKGQRALIVAQPKTGKTLLMKDIANSIARHHPEAYLMMLLIDERPEEVTDMARTVNAEVVASTFDAPAENHVKIAGLVLEKAKRMVECGHDIVIFLDSITRLARAYNTVSPASGKVLSGGVDANALHKPKRFFGAARNIENGGSLTIIATALIDTGSKMDEVIFEEFKGTGNMELQLDRQLANKRIFPAVNLVASSTRRDDLLLPQTTLNRMWVLRKHIADMNAAEAMDVVMKNMERTINNEEFLVSMNG